MCASFNFKSIVIFFLLALATAPLERAQAFNDKDILKKADTLIPVLDSLLNIYWPDVTCRSYIAGQIEQETCASLNKCWNSNVELKTAREYGFGLAQITIAFNKDGSERFNNFLEAQKKYKELSEWKWENRFSITSQLIYLILECRNTYSKLAPCFSSEIQIFAASFVTYNAGLGTVLKRRALCKTSSDCNSDKWFGGLDSVHLTNEEVLLYGQQLYKRRNDYPANIILQRSKKYEQYF